MRGLLLKIFWEVRWQVVGFSAALAIAMGLLTALLPKVLGDIHLLFDRLPFVRPLLTALLGVDPGRNLTGTMSQAFLWVHPTVLTLIWAHEVIYCTRTPAGEIDRGTVDFLLGLPISRGKLMFCETVGWLLSGALMLACGYGGHLLASVYLEPAMRPPAAITAFVMLNLYAMYLAVGGFAFFISSISDRRGRAMVSIFAVLLLSFLINFVAQFWDPLKKSGPDEAKPERSVATAPATGVGSLIPGLPSPNDDEQVATGPSLAMFSVLHYYRPAIIIQRELLPARDIGLLLSIAAVFLGMAAVVLRRRSICTV